jgi:hypothetical protein
LNATITVSTYHHRAHRNLQVLSIVGPERPCTVRLGERTPRSTAKKPLLNWSTESVPREHPGNCSLAGEAMDFQVSAVAGGGRRLEVRTMEQPNDPPHQPLIIATTTTPPPPAHNCSDVPQPCPQHPGRTFCPSDPRKGQCSWPSTKSCPKCAKVPACSTLAGPFCHAAKTDPRIFSCASCGSCLVRQAFPFFAVHFD